MLFTCAFYAFKPLEKLDEFYLKLANESMVVIIKPKFLEFINLRVPPSKTLKNPSSSRILKDLYKMGYQDKLKGIVEFKRGNFQLYGSMSVIM